MITQVRIRDLKGGERVDHPIQGRAETVKFVTPNGPGRRYSHRLWYESGWSANYNLDDTVPVITPDEAS